MILVKNKAKKQVLNYRIYMFEKSIQFKQSFNKNYTGYEKLYVYYRFDPIGM